VCRRVVDATYLSPSIPATTPSPFGVADGVRVMPVNRLADMDEAAGRYVVIGSGKTRIQAVVLAYETGIVTPGHTDHAQPT